MTIEEIGCWDCVLDGVKSGKSVCPDCGTDTAYYCKKYSHQNVVSEIDSKERWIPCSIRLPKPNETKNLIAKYYLVQNEYGDMMVARWDGNGWEQMYQHEYLENDIIAWMPLPEKYKAGTEEKE